MTVPIQELTLRDGAQPEVEVIFGQAQIGSYRCFLWNEKAANPRELMHGNNLDAIPDKFAVAGEPAKLKGSFLSWEMLIQTPDFTPGQLYSVTVLVRQGGSIVQGGVLQQSGPFDGNTKSAVMFARFV